MMFFRCTFFIGFLVLLLHDIFTVFALEKCLLIVHIAAKETKAMTR